MPIIPVQITMGEHAEFIIGRAFARPVGFCPPSVTVRSKRLPLAAATPPYSLLAWPHCITSLGDRAEAEKVADRRASAVTPEQANYSHSPQTQNLDLNDSSFQSSFPKVQLVD